MKSIYVGNLPSNLTEDALRSTFATYGKVESVKIIRDQAGQSRGFAFVEMGNDNEAANAISGLNGSELEGSCDHFPMQADMSSTQGLAEDMLPRR
jgi:RNA recognition motif-containing protein